MRPIAPRTGAEEMTLAEDQEEYLPIVAAKYMIEDGSGELVSPMLVTRWRPTDEERAALAIGMDIFIGIMTFGKPLQPIEVRVGAGDWQLAPTIITDPRA